MFSKIFAPLSKWLLIIDKPNEYAGFNVVIIVSFDEILLYFEIEIALEFKFSKLNLANFALPVVPDVISNNESFGLKFIFFFFKFSKILLFLKFKIFLKLTNLLFFVLEKIYVGLKFFINLYRF